WAREDKPSRIVEALDQRPIVRADGTRVLRAVGGLVDDAETGRNAPVDDRGTDRLALHPASTPSYPGRLIGAVIPPPNLHAPIRFPDPPTPHAHQTPPR